MNLEPDVWEPSADNLAQTTKDTLRLPRTKHTGTKGVQTLPLASKVAMVPTLAIGGHIDVVDVTEDEWTRDPWSLTRGRHPLRPRQRRHERRARSGPDSNRGTRFAWNRARRRPSLRVDEEEDGGVGGALSVLERGYVPDAAVIAEPFDLPNVGIAGAGVMYFRVEVPGKSVHAAWGHEGVNAIGNAATIYRALEELDTERKARIDYEPAYRANPGLKGERHEPQRWDDRGGRLAVYAPLTGGPRGADRLAARRESGRGSVADRRDDRPKPPPTTIGSPTIRRPSSGSAGRPNLTRLTATANLRRSPNASVRMSQAVPARSSAEMRDSTSASTTSIMTLTQSLSARLDRTFTARTNIRLYPRFWRPRRRLPIAIEYCGIEE